MVEVKSKLQEAIETPLELASSQTPLFATAGERVAAQEVIKLIQNAPPALRSADLSRPEAQEEILKRLRLKINQSSLTGTEPVDEAEVIRKTVQLIASLTIDIPRITVVPKGDVTAGYRDFDLDTRGWPRYLTVSTEIVVQHLTDHERYKLMAENAMPGHQRLEDYLVFELIEYNEISYDDTAELLYKLAGQAVAYLQSYLPNRDEVKSVLEYHRKDLAKLIFAQMDEHFEQKAAQYEVIVNKGFQTIKLQAVAVDAGTATRDFRRAVEDKSEIAGMLFAGFRKCLQSSAKFQSDPERVFSVILEDDADVLKWFRPSTQDIRILYKSGVAEREYKPDFIVETKDGKWICETKRASDMQDAEVQAKAQAAALW